MSRDGTNSPTSAYRRATMPQVPTLTSTANVVLTTVVTERTLGSLRGLFPQARILLTELHDRDRGIHYPGPISRALEACPDGYFVAHDLDSLPAIVQSEARLQLSGSTRPTQPKIQVGGRRAAAPPGPLWPPVILDVGGIIWVNAPDPSHPVPQGLVLELEHLDRAVAGLLHTSEPRTSLLWASSPQGVEPPVLRQPAQAERREHQSTVLPAYCVCRVGPGSERPGPRSLPTVRRESG